MRDRVLADLDPTRYRRFLVFLLGPYKAHDEPDAAQFAFLEGVRADLRGEGFNAFLATDVDGPIEEIDAASQTIAFARASNAVVFVVPAAGKNLGVGIETGAVLEDVSDRAPERVLFCHEDGVRSALIASVADRWDATVDSYDDREELVDRVRLFCRDVMRAEGTGDLPFPPRE